MAAKEAKNHLNVEELAVLTRRSVSTIWRMKHAGEIPYYQRRKHTRVTFPPDAIKAILSTEQSPKVPKHHPDQKEQLPKRPPGPRPAWMKNKHN